MKRFLALTYLLLSIPTLASEGVDSTLKESKIVTRIKEEVADLDIKFNLDIFDTNVFEGLNLSSKYRYEVEPSYEANFYSRIDKWRLRGNVSIGDILETSSPLYFNINRESEILFVRQFKSKNDALKEAPYGLGKLPVSAKRALRLKAGDFVSLPANLTVTFGAKSSFGTDTFPASLNFYHVIHGKFIIQVFRMPGSKVRMKLIATKGKETGARGDVDLDFETSAVEVLDKGIKRVLDLDLFETSAGKGIGHQLILDYVFDLSNEKASKAYDNILSSRFKFKDLSIFKNEVINDSLENSLVSTFNLAEDVAKEDLGKENKRVERIFKGINDFDFTRSRFKIGLILASYSKDKSYTENNITYESELGYKKKYFYPTYSRKRRGKAGVWPLRYKEETEKQFFGLSPLNDQGVGVGYTDFGVNYWRKDKSFNGAEQASVHQLLLDNLPLSIYNNIDWDEWKKFSRKRNARVFFQVIFKGGAFEKIEDLSQKEVEARILKYLKERKRLYSGKIGNIFRRVYRTVKNGVTINKDAARSLSYKIHAIISNKKDTGKQRIKKLLKLRSYPIFRQLGCGFLASLINEEDLKDSVYFEFNLSATDVDYLSMTYGERAYSNIYEELIQIQNALNNRSYDMRLKDKDRVLQELD